MYVVRLLGFTLFLLALVFWPVLKRDLRDVLPSGARVADLALLVPSPLLHLVTRQCPLHRVTMHLGKVGLSYGLPISDDEGGWQESRRQYPYAGDPVQAGCIPGQRQRAVTWICPDCQREAAAWRAKATAGGPRP